MSVAVYQPDSLIGDGDAEYIPFVNAYWGQQGEETLLNHISTSSQTLSDLRTVYKEL